MVTAFYDFINEYGGPGRAIGFRYSEPNIDYKFSIHTVINPKIGVKKIEKMIKDIFKKYNVGEDKLKFKHVGADQFELSIKIKAYSKYEVLSMINLLFNEVNKEIGDNIIFILDSINIEGKDLNVERKTNWF